jgi:hypothetical protein
MTFKTSKMKLQNISTSLRRAALISSLMLSGIIGFTQQTDSTAAAEEPAKPARLKPVKNTFESQWIIDNQTVMVPIRKTFEMDIMHRFGTVKNGYDDFWGFFAPSNIRLGVSYAPINKLSLGVGITKSNMLWDGSAKYSIIQQTKGKYPLSVTYYGNVSYDTRKDKDGSLFRYRSDRVMFYNSLILARKINDKLSVQLAPNISHQNSVYGYYKQVDSATKVIAGEMDHNHWAVGFSARYKVTTVTSVLVNYDQPLTSADGFTWLFGKHQTNNPRPNISFGFEFSTGSHAFQLFAGNYSFLSPQRNNLYNKNDYTHGQFLIGFNVTRLWNY